MDIMSEYRKLISVFLIFFISSCVSTNQLLNSEQIRLGMSIEYICDATVFTSMLDDPCMGYSSYIEDKNALILYNSNNTLYLVFENITGSDFRRTGGINSKLILIANSYQEANFYVQNIMN
tara:strand:+ start:946 stop:1308 length:363 start_codon:yes stop_codon:yes gene_type:complete